MGRSEKGEGYFILLYAATFYYIWKFFFGIGSIDNMAGWGGQHH